MTLSLTILEGADGTGKSVYAAWLQRFIGRNATVLHYGKPSSDWRTEYYGRFAENPALHTILDRSFIGSRVWASLGFHPEPLSEKNWRLVCWSYAMHSERVQAIVVVRDVEEIRETIANRGEVVQQEVDAVRGQIRFLQLLARNEVYYLPIAAVTSNRIHNHIEEQ